MLKSASAMAVAIVAVSRASCCCRYWLVSSASIVVHATGLTKTDATASSSVEDSGSANPDDDFRYDSDLGGYIFNLSTKGLSTGTWVLSFTVDGEVESSYSVKFDVK